MTHIFISYAHTDETHLDKIAGWLRNNGFAEHEFWYDQHIDGGRNWRDEISDALDEAFAVLVIVTGKSANSLYCTYEWSYAMGQGIQIFPLVFDNVSAAEVPMPLTSKQFINCIETIPNSLKEQLEQLKSVPPQVAALNKTIYEIIYDTHRRYFVLNWVGEGLEALDDEFIQTVMTYFVKTTSEAHQALQTLMIDKAFAFNNRQYRLCWKLVDVLHKLSRLQPEYERYLPVRLASQFENVWLPAFEYFEGSGRWSKWIRRYFEWDLDEERNKMQVLVEITRAFPIFDMGDADVLIHNKNIRRHQQ